jgi:hypothetical protein
MHVEVAQEPPKALCIPVVSTMGAIVKISRENLALAVLWGAIGACAILVALAPDMKAVETHGGGVIASLARTGF